MKWRILLGFFLFVVALRTGAAFALRGNLQDDPDGYRALARNLQQQGGYVRGGHPTAYRPPLYPFLLAAMGGWPAEHAARIAALHVLAGALTSVIVLQLAWSNGLRSGAWLSAAGVALDPLLLYQSTLVMTETLATLLAAAVLLVDARLRRAPSLGAGGCCGAALGLAVLCRPTFLPWLVLLLASYLLGPTLRRAGIVALLTAAAVLAPWILRNWWVLGRPIAATSHGGYTLWLANNPEFYDYLRQPRPDPPLWSSRDLDQRQLELLRELDFNELALDRLSYARAWQCIQDRPGDFLWSCAVRLGRFWRLTPHPQTRQEVWQRRAARFAVGGWYAALYLAAAFGAGTMTPAQRRQGPWTAGWLLALTLSAVHTLFWSNLRMRAPLMPWLYLLAGAAAHGRARLPGGEARGRARLTGGRGSREGEAPGRARLPPSRGGR